MNTGAFTGYFDVAQVVLYVFWIFFAGLIIYLHREDKREGYPLESDRSPHIKVQGYPAIPLPKTFRLASGHEILAPLVGGSPRDRRPIMAKESSPVPGSPLVPIGNPMLAGVGPGSWVEREDEPERMINGDALIVPLRVAAGFSVASEDPDPRGMDVVGADKLIAGSVKDVWVDRAEPQIRYLEVALKSGRSVILPIHFSKFDVGRSRVNVRSILSTQFADVPALSNPDRITKLEEDKITAYYAGGTLYATAARSEPFI
jgi:photosynthetic reaction center H subunit